MLPFFHIYGMTVMMNHGLRRDATVVTMPKFDLAGVPADHLASTRSTALYIAPPIAVALAKHPMVDEYDLSLRRRSSSPVRPPLDAELGKPSASAWTARCCRATG